MEALLLRLDAPLMSFGGVVVDEHNPTDPLPYRAMLAGLLANALGMTRAQEREFASLQSRIRYAARRDRRGETLVDYQTVDLSPDGPLDSALGWTTRGTLEERKGGTASDGTHIRYRHYLADAIVTVALTLEPPESEPSLRSVSDALRLPARALFLGRKCCLPSGPVWLAEVAATTLREALERTPRVSPLRPGADRRSDEGKLQAVWPQADGGAHDATRLWPRVEDRDPANSIHVGRRLYVEGLVDPPETTSTERDGR